MQNPFQVVKDFEKEVAEYCGAPYCVAVNSCTSALFLCLQRWKILSDVQHIYIPKKTYISVPMQIIHAGFEVRFTNEEWKGVYRLAPFPIYDAARRFTSGMFSSFEEEYGYRPFICTSHHWNKILGLQQGGCILHNDPVADAWFRRARFDGRTEGVAPSQDRFDMLGWHCYLSPEIAAQGLVRLAHLPRHNADMPNDDYPDLSQMEIFNENVGTHNLGSTIKSDAG